MTELDTQSPARSHSGGNLWRLLAAAALLAGAWSVAGSMLGADSRPAAVTCAATQPQSKAQVDQQTLEFLKVNEPDVYASAVLLRDKDAKKYEALMREMNADVKHLLEIEKRNHDMFVQAVADKRLGYQALQLAKSLRNDSLSGDARKRQGEDLKAVVAQQFDTRRQLRLMELEELSARISKLQDQLNNMKRNVEERDQRKEDLVAQRLKELLSVNPKVDW